MSIRPNDKSFLQDKLPKCITLKVTNSYFYGNKNLFMLLRGNLYIDNCIFEETDSVDNIKASIIISENTYNKITIKNSIFKDNKTDKNVPLLYLVKANIEIRNTTFIDNNSMSGSLIYGEFLNKYYNNKLLLLDTRFSGNDNIIRGKDNDIIINNCELENTTLRSSLPIISDCVNSNILIENSHFRNLKIQGNGLIGPESTYILNNLTISDIMTNGNSLFTFLNKNVEFNNVKIKNIKNVGDINDSSFIYFDSGVEAKSLILNNINIEDCEFNGKMIRILGENNYNEIKNSTINNNISYGSLISYESVN
ncbi:hypothetical protein PIROE2DRAFT_6385, partial [Piromyces sp. E2]